MRGRGFEAGATIAALESARSQLAEARRERDRRIRCAVREKNLTRRQIAKAVGLVKSRVDQIARGE